MNVYKSGTKMKGPGGLQCPCCNPFYYSPKHGKPVFHRAYRRKQRKFLQGLLKSSEQAAIC